MVMADLEGYDSSATVWCWLTCWGTLGLVDARRVWDLEVSLVFGFGDCALAFMWLVGFGFGCGVCFYFVVVWVSCFTLGWGLV